MRPSSIHVAPGPPCPTASLSFSLCFSPGSMDEQCGGGPACGPVLEEPQQQWTQRKKPWSKHRISFHPESPSAFSWPAGWRTQKGLLGDVASVGTSEPGPSRGDALVSPWPGPCCCHHGARQGLSNVNQWKEETSMLGRDLLLREETQNFTCLKELRLKHLPAALVALVVFHVPFCTCHLHMALAPSTLILSPAFLQLFLT